MQLTTTYQARDILQEFIIHFWPFSIFNKERTNSTAVWTFLRILFLYCVDIFQFALFTIDGLLLYIGQTYGKGIHRNVQTYSMTHVYSNLLQIIDWKTHELAINIKLKTSITHYQCSINYHSTSISSNHGIYSRQLPHNFSRQRRNKKFNDTITILQVQHRTPATQNREPISWYNEYWQRKRHGLCRILW